MIDFTRFYFQGCDPTIMGIGPVEAIKGLCEKTGVSLDKVYFWLWNKISNDTKAFPFLVAHIEVNEAFAAQTLAVKKQLGIDSVRPLISPSDLLSLTLVISRTFWMWMAVQSRLVIRLPQAERALLHILLMKFSGWKIKIGILMT